MFGHVYDTMMIINEGIKKLNPEFFYDKSPKGLCMVYNVSDGSLKINLNRFNDEIRKKFKNAPYKTLDHFKNYIYEYYPNAIDLAGVKLEVEFNDCLYYIYL